MTENKRFTLVYQGEDAWEHEWSIKDNQEKGDWVIIQGNGKEIVECLNNLHEENQTLKQELSDVYVEKGSNEYYKQLFEEKCKEIEVLEKRVNWFIECIERMGYKVVKE